MKTRHQLTIWPIICISAVSVCNFARAQPGFPGAGQASHSRGVVHTPLAARFFHHSMRTRSRCFIKRYEYGHDDPRESKRVLAFSFSPEDVSEISLLKKKKPPGDERSNVPTDTYSVARRRFHFPVPSVTVGPITLSQVGLALLNTGRLYASGAVFHDGGPTGAQLGSRVTIHLRCYAGPKVQGVPFADAPLLWHCKHSFWARRGQRRVIDFGPELAKPDLRRFFNEISHLELELEYKHSR